MRTTFVLSANPSGTHIVSSKKKTLISLTRCFVVPCLQGRTECFTLFFAVNTTPPTEDVTLVLVFHYQLFSDQARTTASPMMLCGKQQVRHARTQVECTVGLRDEVWHGRCSLERKSFPLLATGEHTHDGVPMRNFSQNTRVHTGELGFGFENGMTSSLVALAVRCFLLFEDTYSISATTGSLFSLSRSSSSLALFRVQLGPLSGL